MFQENKCIGKKFFLLVSLSCMMISCCTIQEDKTFGGKIADVIKATASDTAYFVLSSVDQSWDSVYIVHSAMPNYRNWDNFHDFSSYFDVKSCKKIQFEECKTYFLFFKGNTLVKYSEIDISTQDPQLEQFVSYIGGFYTETFYSKGDTIKLMKSYCEN